MKTILPRSKYRTSIAYYLIIRDYGESYADFISAPREFEMPLYNFLALCPVDLTQVINPSGFYRMKCNEVQESCLNLNIIFENNFSEYFENEPDDWIKVVVIGAIDNYESVISKITKKNKTYFTVLDDQQEKRYEENEISAFRYFHTALSLTKLLRRDWGSLATEDEKNIFEKYLTPQVVNNSASLEKIPIFKAAYTNFFVESQATGNYWMNEGNVSDYTEEYLSDQSKQILQENVRGINKDSRLKIYLRQFIKLDNLFKENNWPIAVTDIDAEYPPLIFVVPFQNPQAKKLSEIYGLEAPDLIHKLLKAEQNINYIFSKAIDDEKPDHEEFRNAHIGAVARIIYPRLLYLDFIKYLHATFTFSPSARLPLLGDSIVKELSFLRPGTKNRLTGKSLNKTILKFGKRLSELVFNPEMEAYIASRNSQITVISDLPVEWAQIKGLPLCYTHDVCRIPETNLKGPMSLYAVNSHVTYTIPKNIIEKTLVIFGSPIDEEHYESVTKMAISECERLSIKFKRVASVYEFVAAVNEIRPELLIIDCHGGYDQETLASYLEINGEKLTHEKIVETGLYAPIIFLSACATSPNYGYVHSIANAFFHNGSLTITSTYLPISIFNGTVTYLRLLLHLDQSAKNGDFSNWLAYVSTSVRTSIFTSIIDSVYKQIDKLPPHKKKNARRIYGELEKVKDMIVAFPKRRSTFERMNELLNNIDENIRIDIKTLAQENLLYTHLGRPDLIKFEKWIERKSNLRKKVLNIHNNIDPQEVNVSSHH